MWALLIPYIALAREACYSFEYVGYSSSDPYASDKSHRTRFHSLRSDEVIFFKTPCITRRDGEKLRNERHDQEDTGTQL